MQSNHPTMSLDNFTDEHSTHSKSSVSSETHTLTVVCKSVERGHLRNSGAHSPTHDLQCATLSSSLSEKAQRKYRDSFCSITSSESFSGPQTFCKILQINRDHSLSDSNSRPAVPTRPDCLSMSSVYRRSTSSSLLHGCVLTFHPSLTAVFTLSLSWSCPLSGSCLRYTSSTQYSAARDHVYSWGIPPNVSQSWSAPTMSPLSHLCSAALRPKNENDQTVNGTSCVD